MVTLVSSAAMAGTGIGSLFNLGATNRVNARSQLEGATPSAVLNVTNTNGSASASGVSIDVPAGHAPLVVNSATKVNNLNADLLDGRSGSEFQGAVSEACPNGTAISSIAPTGAATCNSSVVLSINEHLPQGGPETATFPYEPSSLGLLYNCANTRAVVEFQSLGQSPATLTFSYASNGAAPTVGTMLIPPGSGYVLAAATQDVGQFIYYDQTSVTTISISANDEGPDGCEFYGTVDEAPRS
jgi:hypothetical protein